ncbi:putative leucine-rich repeat-containing protein DDB_G0290503 isoform X2 [Aphidius gifuensis]|uniref:putative leucine-rich repeat-containing protein DDB_G0290503 isoform X2 n=1 Tax=Aphidius gifuensis TaxID=684658 RepID=UPI001CDC446B|nr:putative leucine-rich repeat-containing protein DDB_G0290503 isoform X2 [Aphidius gifuensis]
MLSEPGKILPIEFLLDVLKDFSPQEEIEQLRYELNKYKSLKFTPEQEKQLIALGLRRDKTNFSVYYQNKNESDEKVLDVVDFSVKSLQTEETFDSKIDELSVDSDISISNKYSDIKLDNYNQEYDTKTDDDTLSNEGLISQNSYSRTTINENYESPYSCTAERSEFEDDSLSESDSKSKITVSQGDISRSFDSRTKDTIIKKEAKLIAFENKIQEKNIELEELKEFNITLQNLVGEQVIKMNDLKEKLESTNEKLYQINLQHDSQFREWKKELSKGTNLIDQLKKRHDAKCHDLEIKIEKLRNNSNEADELRYERDTLLEQINDTNKLVEDAGFNSGIKGIETLIYSYLKSTEAERHLSLLCTDHENEISRLSKIIEDTYKDNENKLTKKTRLIDELKADLKENNDKINNYKENIILLKKQYQEFYEDCRYEDELSDNAFATYIKKSIGEINKFLNALEGAEDAKQQVFNKMEEDKNYYNKKLQIQANEISKLRKLNDELNKNAIIFDNVKETNSKITIKLTQLHNDYQESTKDNQILINNLNEKEKKISELISEKDKLLFRVDDSEAIVVEKDLKIKILQKENLDIKLQLDKNNEKLINIRKEMNFLNTKNENINKIKKLDEEINNYKKDKQKLENKIIDLHEELKNYKYSNDNLDKKYSNLLIENKNLSNIISRIDENKLQNILNTDNLPQSDVIHKQIETFIKRIDSSSNNESKNNLNKKNSRKKLKEYKSEFNINNDKEKMIESLKKENNELRQKIDHDKIEHEDKLEKLAETYQMKIEDLRDDHNVSVLRLKAQCVQSDQDDNDTPKPPLSMSNIIGNYDYRHSSSVKKNPIIMDNEISFTNSQNPVDFFPYTDDSKAERYICVSRDNQEEAPVLTKGKTFMAHCSTIERSNNI